MLLEGKTSFISGTSKGIGRSIAEIFAKNKSNIICHVRKSTPGFVEWAKSLEKKYNIKTEIIEFDLDNIDDGINKIKLLFKTLKSIDVLVNNAGITHNSTIQMTTQSDLESQIKINFYAPYRISQLIIKKMLRHKAGSIINIVSSAAFDGNPGKTAYGASKAALYATSNSLASELGSFNIRVNSIAPGVTETNMLRDSMTEQVINDSAAATDLKRIGRPQEIANVALFLASDMSSYITGQTLRVDGGMR